MLEPLDPERIQVALELIEGICPENRLLHMKNLCVNNGIWAIPDDPKWFNPVLWEISLFGVSASANNREDLPGNWIRAARNILNHPTVSPGLETSE